MHSRGGRQLLGTFTDGDLRRALQKRGSEALTLALAEVMAASPRTCSSNLKAIEAMQVWRAAPLLRPLLSPLHLYPLRHVTITSCIHLLHREKVLKSIESGIAMRSAEPASHLYSHVQSKLYLPDKGRRETSEWNELMLNRVGHRQWRVQPRCPSCLSLTMACWWA